MEVRDDVDVSVGVAKNSNMLATEVGPAVKTFTHDFSRITVALSSPLSYCC